MKFKGSIPSKPAYRNGRYALTKREQAARDRMTKPGDGSP